MTSKLSLNKNAGEPSGEPTTKERIVDAAIDLFSQKGIDAVSMNDIAEAVGIKKASIYFHFKSKDEIVESIFDIFSAAIVQTGIRDEAFVDHALDTIGLEGLMSNSSALMSRLGSDRLGKIWRITTLEVAQREKFRGMYLQHVWDAPIVTWERVFERAMAKKMIKPCNPKFLAMEYLAFYWLALVEHNLLKYDDTVAGKPIPTWEGMPDHIRFLLEKIKA